MKNKKLTNKKLKTIAILSAITICSSMATSTIKSDAMVPTFKLGVLTQNLGRGLNKLSNLLSRGWTKFRNILTSKGTTSSTSSGVVNKAHVDDNTIYSTILVEPRTKEKITVKYTLSNDPRTRPLPAIPKLSSSESDDAGDPIYSAID